MNKLVYLPATDRYFVQGYGFTGQVHEATEYDCDEEAQDVVNCAAAMGLGNAVIQTKLVAAPVEALIKQNADGTSFAVSFIRPKDMVNGQVQPNKLNPSKRRFATEEEAKHHGARFAKIEKHLGFYVTKTFDPVNAYVNQVTGKTNPLIGRARTNR